MLTLLAILRGGHTVQIADVKQELHFLACVLHRHELAYACHQLVLVHFATAVVVEALEELLREEILLTEYTQICVQTIPYIAMRYVML